MPLEVNKHRVKSKYYNFVCPHQFSEGELVLLCDQTNESFGEGKFNPMWHGPYVVKCVLEKGAYEMEDCEGNALMDPRNRIYLKKYYA